MEKSSICNQINLAFKHLDFYTPMGIYYYKVVSFCLKDARAIYQKTMTKITSELIHKVVECHVNDHID